jgi:eukaryotic-like serine/threonine-protein kinase
VNPLKSSDPSEIGDIRLSGRLGHGGMGIVYFGVTAGGEQVAVKMIRDELIGRSGVRGRFDREIQILGMVQGPRVAGLVAEAEPGEMPPWFATEYVRGLTLTEYVQDRGALAPSHGAALGILLAEGLTEIHQAGLLHRDLKPSNVILGSDGPRIIDFGLAALAEVPGDITRSSDMIGTPVCMAPEQATAIREVTEAADMYALGAVLLFAVTGHYPYKGPTTPAIWHALTDAATEPDLSGLPERLMPIVGSLLAQDPAARPTLAEVTSRLREITAEPFTDALSAFITDTYIERDTDPAPATLTQGSQEPQRPPRRRLSGEPNVPNDLVRQIAENLRHEYARGARL